MVESATIKMSEYDMIVRILNDHVSVCYTSMGAHKAFGDENPDTNKRIEEIQQEIFEVNRVIAKIIAHQNSKAMEGLL